MLQISLSFTGSDADDARQAYQKYIGYAPTIPNPYYRIDDPNSPLRIDNPESLDEFIARFHRESVMRLVDQYRREAKP